MSETMEERRARLRVTGAAGGRAARGELKARGGRAASAVRAARVAALKELAEVAREAGAFLDGLSFPLHAEQEERRRDLTDRLYSAVSKLKEVPGARRR